MFTTACFILCLLITGCASIAPVRPVREGVVYRSGRLASKDLETSVRKHDIRTVVNLSGGEPDEVWRRDQGELLRDLRVKVIDVPMDSGEPDPQAIADLLDIYRTEEKPILLQSRSRFGSAGFASGLYRVAIEREAAAKARKELAPWQTKLLPFVPGSAHDRYLAEWRGEERFAAEHEVAKSRQVMRGRTIAEVGEPLQAGEDYDSLDRLAVRGKPRQRSDRPSMDSFVDPAQTPAGDDDPPVALGPPRPIADKRVAGRPVDGRL